MHSEPIKKFPASWWLFTAAYNLARCSTLLLFSQPQWSLLPLHISPFFSRKAITGIEKGLDFFLHSTVLTAVTGPVQPAHPFTCVFRLLWVIWSFDPFWHFLMPKLTFHRVALLLCDWQADLLLSAWIFSSCFSCWYFSAQSSDLQQFSILCSAPFCPSESPAISGHTPSVFPLLPVLVSFPDLL